MIKFRFEIVGGSFDGAPGLSWNDDGEHPTPDLIYVARCRGRGECGRCPSSFVAAHVSYWVAELEEVPRRALEYRKEDEYVARDGEDERLFGVTRYVFGGIDMFGRLEERELAGAVA